MHAACIDWAPAWEAGMKIYWMQMMIGILHEEPGESISEIFI